MAQNHTADASQIIGNVVEETVQTIKTEVCSRAFRASNELRNASLQVLRGTRSGRIYRKPNTKATYQASAPGEPPASRNGHFMDSWKRQVRVEQHSKKFQVISSIESHLQAGGRSLGEMLENGTRKMAPRPYKQKILDQALPKIQALYQRPFS